MCLFGNEKEKIRDKYRYISLFLRKYVYVVLQRSIFYINNMYKLIRMQQILSCC